MKAVETFLIYVVPFVAFGLLALWWMRRASVDMDDLQSQAGSNRRRRRRFLLGAWRYDE